MKKIVLAFLLIFSFGITIANAEEIAVPENISVSATKQANEPAIISENDKIEIIEQNGQYGIRNKETQNMLLAAEWENIIPLDEDYTQFKIKKEDRVGYCNIELKTIFLAQMQDVSLLGNYVRIKNKGKYGITDKEGNILLSPVFQKVAIIKNGDTEYFSGKVNGKYRLFYNTGKLVGEEELYTVTPNTLTLLVSDIKPIFKESYEAKTINYVKTEFENKKSYEVGEVEIPDTIKIASIKKDVIVKTNNEKTQEFKHGLQGLLTIRNRDYVIVKNNGKIGLSYNSKEILPPEFDTISLKTPCKCFFYPVIIVNKENTYYAYDVKGKLLSEAVNNNVKLYRHGKTYTYNNGVVSKDGKAIGTLEKNKKGYKFIKKGCLIPPHIVNELILTMLTIEK